MPYVYQAGDNCYRRGDYYRGDYYRGDPGLFGFLAKAAGAVFRTVVPGGGAVLDVAGGLLKATRRPAPGTSLATIPQYPAPQITSGVQVQSGIVNFGGGGFGGGGAFGGGGGGGGGQVPMVVGPDGKMCQLRGYHLNKAHYWTRQGEIAKGTKCVKNRRMDVANVHALRRAIRRGRGFIKIARKAATMLGYTVVTKGSRTKGKAVARRR